MAEVGGVRANSHGQLLENIITTCFAGVRELSRTEKYQHTHIDPPWYARQFRLYPSLFGKPMIHDVYYYGGKFPKGLVLEVKWQSSPGSVYEKLPFTLMSLASMPAAKVLIIEGPCHPAWAVTWCREFAKTHRGLSVMNLSEFIVWTHDKL